MLLTSLIFVTIELVKCVFRIPFPSRVSNPYRPPPPVVQSRPISNQSPSRPKIPFYQPKKQPFDSTSSANHHQQQQPFISAPPLPPPSSQTHQQQGQPFVSAPDPAPPSSRRTSIFNTGTRTKFRTYTKYNYKSILDFSSINKIHVMFSSVSYKQEL